MVLRLLAHNAEHWLSGHLNAYLRDDDEYRAITRQTIIRGLAGTITWTPAAITVTLEQPGAPRIARALALLIDEINATPPAMPGDTRPITYQLAPRPRHLTPDAQPLPEIWGRAEYLRCRRQIQSTPGHPAGEPGYRGDTDLGNVVTVPDCAHRPVVRYKQVHRADLRQADEREKLLPGPLVLI